MAGILRAIRENLVNENSISHPIVVYPLCTLLAAGIGTFVFVTPHLVGSFAFQDHRLYAGGCIQIYRSRADVSVQNIEVELINIMVLNQ